MTKITGDKILLYTDNGLVAFSTSASVDYNHQSYELLPNSYSKKRNYGIVDWSVSGDFYFDTSGNYHQFIDKINIKEKVAVLVVENNTFIKFGYGIINSVSYSAPNQQTVSFSVDIAGVSKLSQYADPIAVNPTLEMIRLIDNQIYITKLIAGALTIRLMGASGARSLVSVTIADETLVDFTIFDDCFIIVTNVKVYKINKNGYKEIEVSSGMNAYSRPKKVFDSQGDYIAFLSDDSEVKIYNNRLVLYDTITATTLLDYVQLSNGNYLLSSTTAITLKSPTNATIATAAITQTTGKLFKASNEDIYLTSNTGLFYFNNLENDAVTKSTVSNSNIVYINELEAGLLIGVISGGGSSILFKDRYLKGAFTDNVPVGDGGAGSRYFEIDTNGVVYSVESSELDGYAPTGSYVTPTSDYTLPIVKFL
jgi:hypothetical protein